MEEEVAVLGSTFGTAFVPAPSENPHEYPV